MAGDYIVKVKGETVGRVVKFEGEPRAKRWVAYGRRVELSDPEAIEKFPTRKDAVSWLVNRPEAQSFVSETVTQ